MNKIVKTPAEAEPAELETAAGGATRRGLIVGATLAGGALLVGCSPADILSLGADSKVGAFGAFIKIDRDGAVTVMNKHQEMGQGNHVGLAAIVAEELDADWDKVKVEAAPANAKLYGNTLFPGIQGTGGSTAINNSWDQLRKAGATARALFVEAASKRWSTPAKDITVKDGVVSHIPTGRSAGFGELLAEAAQQTPPQSVVLKAHRDFTLIGSDRLRRKDSLAKSTGTQRYTQDVNLPNMLVACVAHAPRFGGKVKSFDDAEARKVPGVVDVFAIPSGVAVVAQNTYAAKTAKLALKIVWDEAKAETRSSDQILAEYKTLVAGKGDPKVKAQPFQTAGDATTAFGGGLFEATYDFPYLAHATMEPMNCVAQVDGNKVKLTTASQIQTLDQLNTALAVGTLPGAVEIETLSAGGSFGRRATPNSDYVMDAVHVAKHVGHGRPVKMVWTREDDMTAGKYRPMVHHALAIKLGADGLPAAWRHRIATQSINKGTPLAKGLDETTVEGVKGSPYLTATPVVDAQVYMPDSPVPVLWWRSVGATHTALVMEHTIDRLAKAAAKDPADYRRALYRKAKADRHLAVLDLACDKAGWGQPLPAGVARGVAVHESFGSVVAQVAEVKLVDGKPRVLRVVCAIDCGTPIALDQIAAQMEGGVCYGLAAALYGQITLKDGVVEQTNFDAYPVLRMNEAPVVETHIIASTAHPTGVGEPGTPLIAPAVANALLALNGTVTASLPFVKG